MVSFEQSQSFTVLIYAFLIFLGHNVRTSKFGVDPVDTSGVDVVIKALKDLVN